MVAEIALKLFKMINIKVNPFEGFEKDTFKSC